MWREALGLEAVGPDENFFDLGGSSILFAEMLDELHQLVDMDVTIVTLFKYPTIRALAVYVAGEPGHDLTLAKVPSRVRRQREARRQFRERVKEGRQRDARFETT